MISKSLAFAILAISAAANSASGQKPDAVAPAVTEPTPAPAETASVPVPIPPVAIPPEAVPPERAEVPGNAFILGPEDVIYIRVMHEPDLTGPQDVRPDGMIVMQLIGELKAAGRSPSQLAAEIRTKLLQSMRNPEVTVQLTKVNSRKFTIQGEVNRPGTYTFSTPVTVLEALVEGQGFKDFANVKKIYILRGNQRLPFNYKNVSHGKQMDANIKVENGDQIFVP